jgi:putative transposase
MERRSIRLPGYDYSSDGTYFITICVRHRECLLGEILDGRSILNQYGEIVRDNWKNMADTRSEIELDAYIIMPNYFHAILSIDKSPESVKIYDALDSVNPKDRRKMLLPKIVGQFKMRSAKAINQIRQVDGAFWQHNYYEQIVRSEGDCQRIRSYIINNPLQWEMDEHYHRSD